MHAFNSDYGSEDNVRFLSKLERFGRAYRELRELYRALDIDDSGIRDIFTKIDGKVELLVYTIADEVINDLRPVYIKRYMEMKGIEDEDQLTNDDMISINRELVKKYDWFLEESGMGQKGEKKVKQNP